MTTIHTAADLAAAIRDLRPDAATAGVTITTDWCRAQMHALGVTRYEDVDDDTLSAIADRVDTLAEPAQACQCCGGSMPGRTTWEAHRDEAGECDGSIDRQGHCRAWSDATLWETR